MEEEGTSQSDSELVVQARRGNSEAYERLVRRHYRSAHATALALVGSVMDAEDVCQEAFIRALERLDTCRSPDKFRAWLLSIVRNQAHNYREYQQVRAGPSLEETTPVSSADPARDSAQSELREQLEGALGTLTEVQRKVVLLHDLEDWKHQEIAESLEMSVESSRQHLFVARKHLRRELGKDTVRTYLHDPR